MGWRIQNSFPKYSNTSTKKSLTNQPIFCVLRIPISDDKTPGSSEK